MLRWKSAVAVYLASIIRPHLPSFVIPTFLFQAERLTFICLVINTTMSDEKKVPLLAEEPKDPPPAYEDAANSQAPLAVRNGPSSTSSKPLPRGPFPLDIPVLKQLRGKRVIIASASPRRKQILSMVRHAHLTSCKAQLTETDLPKTRNPTLHLPRKPQQRPAGPLRIRLADRNREMSQRLPIRPLHLPRIHPRPLTRHCRGHHNRDHNGTNPRETPQRTTSHRDAQTAARPARS